VPIEHEGAKYSAWLSADELEIYYIFRGDDSGLYHGVRTHRDMPFNQIKKVDLGADFQVLNGPSLTPDGKYLMLRIVDTDGLFMLFEKEGEDRFKMVQELPLSFETSPGQLSKDGNKLIVPCDDGSPQKGLFSFCLMEKSNPNDAGFDK
jgi:hypothetical protein